MSVMDINLAAAKALGIDPTGVQSFTVHFAAGKYPTVTINRLVQDDQQIRDITEQFALIRVSQ